MPIKSFSKLPFEVQHTIFEFTIAYLLTAIFSYITVFKWDWLEGNDLLPDFMKYPCGGRIPELQNFNSSSSSSSSTSTSLFSSVFGEDPFLFNSHQNEPTSLNAQQAFYVIPFTYMVYWTASLCYFIADIYYDNFCPRGVWKSKKHPEANMGDRPNYKLYRHGIRLAFLGNFVSIFATNGLVYYITRRFRWESLCGFEAVNDPLYLTAIKFLCVYFATDFYFYWSHRVCHEVPLLYRKVHKEHHLFVDTYAVCAAACNPIEHVFVNIFTVHLPGVVFGVPLLYLQCGWSMIAALNTCSTHSGFAFVPSFAHDQHHHVQIAEYGTDTVMDRVCRTTCRDRVKGSAGTMAAARRS